MHNWIKLYTTNNYTEANILKGRLEENNIPVTILNKQASPYAGIGDYIDLYVAKQFEAIAFGIISNSLMN